MKTKPLKDALFSVRMPHVLKERLAQVETTTRVTPSILTLESLEAICKYVEKHGEIRMPFELVPRSELESAKNTSNE
jgi:hypothetical protein